MMTDSEREEFKRLQAKQAEEEDELKAAEEQKKAAEEEKRTALKEGDAQKAKKAQETVAASESTIHSLIDRLERTEALLIAIAEERGVPKEKIEQIKRNQFGRVGR